MGGNSSSSSHTETHAGAQGANGMIFMGSSSLEKKKKGAVTLTVGKGGKDGPGEDTSVKLSDGTVLVSASGGGKATGTNNFDRKAHPDWGWNKYGLGGASDQPGGDGYGMMTVFTLKIAKKEQIAPV